MTKPLTLLEQVEHDMQRILYDKAEYPSVPEGEPRWVRHEVEGIEEREAVGYFCCKMTERQGAEVNDGLGSTL